MNYKALIVIIVGFLCLGFHALSYASTSNFLVILVNAPHLNYCCASSLLKTIAKHPRNGSKCGDVGHAWIYLQGILDDQLIILEGGHSGETGRFQAKYCDGIADLLETGDPNPASYLWATQKDGFFQEGCGGHWPTYAICVGLTASQFQQIWDFIQTYPFQEYAITRNQCATFVSQVAALAGLTLECRITVPLPRELKLAGEQVPLWTDPCYSELTISSPDILEASMQQAVQQGQAAECLQWYKCHHPVSFSERMRCLGSTLYHFPRRLLKVLCL